MKRSDQGTSDEARPTRPKRRAVRGLAWLSAAAALLLAVDGLRELAPVAHADAEQARAAATEPDPATPLGDPTQADFWRYCAIDGFLSSCCGGSHTTCPPGTEMSPITWLGTCRNPADGKDYVISYNDCCGKSLCGRCFTNRNEGEKPVYYIPKANDINWCMGSKSVVYNSTVAIVVGVASEGEGP